MQLERMVSKQNKILPLSFLPEDGQKILDALSNLDYTVKIGLNECLKCDKFGIPVLELEIELQRLRMRSVTESIAPPAVLVAISWVKLIHTSSVSQYSSLLNTSHVATIWNIFGRLTWVILGRL